MSDTMTVSTFDKGRSMKLYYSPGACSLSPHIALCEAGVSFETARVDLGTKKLADGSDFRAVNPDGYVPVLQLDDGNLLTEGPAIVQYIADLVPGKELAPANGTLARYRLQSMLNFISTELHKSFSPLFNPATSVDWKEAAKRKIAERLDHLEQRMTGQYALGNQFSVADCYLFTVLRWSKPMKIDLARWPGLAAHQARVAARPAVQQALREEGLA
jgi:glutathione S-transferase